MIPLIVVGAVLLFFALLLSLRIRFVITLRDEVALTLCVLCFRFRIYPRKKRVKWKDYSPKRAERLARKKAKKEAKRKKKQDEAAKRPRPKTTLPEKISLVRALAAALFRKTRKHLKLSAARIRISVATGDAASTAILYGAVSGVLATLLALLERIMTVKARPPQVQVVADYLHEKSSADVKLVFSIRLIGVFITAFSVALAFLRKRAAQKAAKKQKALTTQ
ncbi:MAG: DUF2953 domain-containing protein [Clostridia bacterium]|nr:DUF2953 domain-containing protein [Clostridia bacterium]